METVIQWGALALVLIVGAWLLLRDRPKPDAPDPPESRPNLHLVPKNRPAKVEVDWEGF